MGREFATFVIDFRNRFKEIPVASTGEEPSIPVMPAKFKHNNKGWTPSEDVYIRRNYAQLPTKAISARLGRTTLAVYKRARDLNVYRFK